MWPKGTPVFAKDAINSLLYGVQMTNAYFLMLIVMLYETNLFIAILLGLMFGMLCAKQIERSIKTKSDIETMPLVTGNAPCCNGN